jgi:uroporphyrinogen-III synthase
MRSLLQRIFSTAAVADTLDAPLQGQCVLVTRPEHQAQKFIQLLQSLGADTIAFPSIEIHPIVSSPALEEAAKLFDEAYLVIFISANAVENGVKWLDNSLKSLKNTKIAAIGESTKKALQQHGLKVDFTPERAFNSTALLELEAFSCARISGRRILIIKGEGGRKLLQDTLVSRGAIIHLANVYQRRVPDADIQPLLELWSKKHIQWITVTSNAALKNLYYMVIERGIIEPDIIEPELAQQAQTWLCQTQLLVPSQRCQQLAQQLGFTQILRAQSATDAAMLEAIKRSAQR